MDPTPEDTTQEPDIPEEPDTGTPTVEWGDCTEPDADKKNPGCPCTENGDCKSGWCVEGPEGGSVCTESCIDSCPTGWACKGISNAASDITFVCVPKWLDLCRPCVSAADCSLQDSECVDYEDAGKFCGTLCLNDTDCPSKYQCNDGQCKLTSGTCECTKKAIKDGAKTSCAVINEHGSCAGERRCEEGGLSECTGQAAAPEMCDGLDNNCNDQVDEGLDKPAGPNSAGNVPAAELTLGVCKGSLKLCAGTGGWVEPDYMALKDYEPVEYQCDGLDNDCDGSIDENCNYLSYGNVFGDGSQQNSDNGEHFMNHTIGTPRFVGTATNESFVLEHRLPKGGTK